MKKDLSIRLTICNVICTLLVVYRHSLNFAAFYPNHVYPDNYNTDIQSWNMNFSRIAVPFFFTLSGYLFFKEQPLNRYSYLEKLKKRIYSLLIPFLIWTMIGMVIMHLVHQIDLKHLSWTECVEGTYFGHLWYVRDLLILVLVAPLFDMLKRNKWIWIAALAVLYSRWILVNGSLLSTEGVFFFLLGAGLHTSWLDFKLPSYVVIPFAVIWVLWPLGLPFAFNSHADKWYVLLGIYTLWQMSGYLLRMGSRWWMEWGGYCFFIYCGHFFLIKVFKLLIAARCEYNDMVSLMAYLLLPLLTFGLLYGAGVGMRKYMTTGYKLLSGGR